MLRDAVKQALYSVNDPVATIEVFWGFIPDLFELLRVFRSQCRQPDPCSSHPSSAFAAKQEISSGAQRGPRQNFLPVCPIHFSLSSVNADQRDKDD
jgi:hypothetical protein